MKYECYIHNIHTNNREEFLEHARTMHPKDRLKHKADKEKKEKDGKK